MLRSLNRSSARGRVCGTPYVGVLGAAVPSVGTNGSGYMFSSVIGRPGYATKRYRGRITSWPSNLTLFAYEDSSLTASAPDGTYEVPWELWEFDATGGAIIGTATITLTFGEITAVVVESLSPSDAQSVLRVTYGVATDTTSSTDVRSAILTRLAPVAETSTATDTQSAASQSLTAATAEILIASDVVHHGGAIHIGSLAETASAIDTVNRLLAASSTRTDAITLVDLLNSIVMLTMSARYRYTVAPDDRSYAVAPANHRYEVQPADQTYTIQ